MTSQRGLPVSKLVLLTFGAFLPQYLKKIFSSTVTRFSNPNCLVHSQTLSRTALSQTERWHGQRWVKGECCPGHVGQKIRHCKQTYALSGTAQSQTGPWHGQRWVKGECCPGQRWNSGTVLGHNVVSDDCIFCTKMMSSKKSLCLLGKKWLSTVSVRDDSESLSKMAKVKQYLFFL